MNNQKYRSRLTLEDHLKELSETIPNYSKLHSLWRVLRDKIEKKIQEVNQTFPMYSYHDSIHSKSIITAIERFLGEERVASLSPTDTLLLLICCYVHDYGMAFSVLEIYNLLKDDSFKNFIIEKQEDTVLQSDEKMAVDLLYKLFTSKEVDVKIIVSDIYKSILLAVQMYIRPNHWKGVDKIALDFRDLFEGDLNNRIILNIIKICQIHGKDVNTIMELMPEEDSCFGDEFHPRFIAALLRLGDLLDLDNGRFPKWFSDAINDKETIIPDISKLHFKKHEAIKHFKITPDLITIIADVIVEEKSPNGYEEGYQVASLIFEWFVQLQEDWKYMSDNWMSITKGKFGSPPSDLDLQVFVDGHRYYSDEQSFQMNMSQDRVLNLLKGSSIYQNMYVGIREMIQNAVDASLLEMWKNIIHNEYTNYELTKDTVLNLYGKDIKPWQINKDIYSKFTIIVELICDKDQQKLELVVKDKGIAIDSKDVAYIANLGSSKEKNPRVLEIMKTMPNWLTPAGFFGIGLQSVFQLTDKIEFYSRRKNLSEKLIVMHSYNSNKGNIEVREVPQDPSGVFFDNSPQGTNVKISIDYKKIFPHSNSAEKYYTFFDDEFDDNDDLEAAFIEFINIIKAQIRIAKYDYFNICFNTIKKENGKQKTECAVIRRQNFFYEHPFIKLFDPDSSYEKLSDERYTIIFNKEFKEIADVICIWDSMEDICYILKIQPCIIEDEDDVNKKVVLPNRTSKIFDVWYKFYPIEYVDSIYQSYLENEKINSHSNFVHWSIYVFNRKVDKYVSIDRERLKPGAISEKHLSEIKRVVMAKWCDQLIKEFDVNNKQYDNKTISSKYLGIIASRAILFLQCVPREKVDLYINTCLSKIKYKNVINNTSYKIEELNFGNGFLLKHLWGGPLFSTFLNNGNLFYNDLLKYDNQIPLDVIKKLPHTLFQVVSILGEEKQGNELILEYKYKLGTTNEKTLNEYIDMNDVAKKSEYEKIVLTENKSYDYYALIKAIFKPYKKFKNLIVNQFPITFHCKRNFYCIFDRSIKNYIIAPFNKKMCDDLKAYIEGDERIDLNEKIVKYGKDKYLTKCVKYILNQNPSSTESEIINDYLDLIKEVFLLLKNH